MTSPDPTFCAAPGCKRGPQRGQLCGQHYDHLGRTIAELADLLTADAAPNLGGQRTGGGHSGGLASERDPGNLRLMGARSDAVTTLAAWADWLRTERQLTAPTVTGWGRRAGAAHGPTCPSNCQHLSCMGIHFRWTIPAARNPETDRRLIATHLDWLLNQPEAGQFWCQIRALWSDLRGYRPVRRCHCGGPVWSELGGGWCSWCATPWTGADLLRLPSAADVA